jgi:hypothetical protein
MAEMDPDAPTPTCSIRDLGECQPRLLVLAQVWSGAGQESLTGS